MGRKVVFDEMRMKICANCMFYEQVVAKKVLSVMWF